MRHAIQSQFAQRGVSLLFSLLALVAISLAALALVRSVDTSSLVLGNLSFKQDATAAADQAMRVAMKWLKSASVADKLDEDDPDSGYYSTTGELNEDDTTTPLDATGQQFADNSARKLIDWDNDSKCSYAALGTYASCTVKTGDGGDINGNKTRFVIFRLCALKGSANEEVSNTCAKPLGSGSGASGRGELKYGADKRFANTAGPYYRIVVRVIGARNTVSFTESIVNFQ